MSGKSVRKQRGVALLVVLILLVMMSALATKISQQFCRNLQKTRYQVSQQQLRWAIQSQQKPLKVCFRPTPAVTARGCRPKSGQSRWRQRVNTTPW